MASEGSIDMLSVNTSNTKKLNIALEHFRMGVTPFGGILVLPGWQFRVANRAVCYVERLHL